MKKLCYILLVMLVMACKPSLPSGVLSSDEMEDVLYDMHVAQAIYNNREGVSDNADIYALRASVLKKHNIEQADWDSSFAYYSRNAKELYNIYNSLAERVNGDVIALGGKADGLVDSEADTANVWNQEPAFILMQQAPFNHVSFEIIPDSTFQDGDRISLQYDVKMIFQDGYRDVVANLFVFYDNDSVATAVTHTTMNTSGIVTINNEQDRLHIKKITGYFILGQNLSQNSSNRNATVMRLASVYNVKLLHFHTTPPEPVEEPTNDGEAPEEQKDSAAVIAEIRDSILKAKPAVVNK